MTRIEIMREHKAAHSRLSEDLKTFTKFERIVAETVTLKYFSNHNWMGGLSTGKVGEHDKAMAYGYTYEEIDEEFERQVAIYEA